VPCFLIPVTDGAQLRTAVNEICATGRTNKGTKDNKKMKRKKETEKLEKTENVHHS
jgi:hypothetical protein